MNTPVSFELAKLLAEKKVHIKTLSALYYVVEEGKETILLPNGFIYGKMSSYNAPLIAETVMWLYEKHGIGISSTYMDDVLKFGYSICSINTNTIEMEAWEFNSLKEGYEAGIEYTLKNLIKNENI